MPTGRMALAIDDRHRPIKISALKWSSGTSAWAGFPVECHVLGPRGNLGEFGIDHALLGLCVGGRGTLQVYEPKQTRRLLSVPGRFTLLGGGFEQRPLAWTGTREMLYVALDSARLDRFMRDDTAADRFRVEPQFTISDSQVASIVLNMRREIRAGCPAGRIYGEALSVALAAYLFGRYSRQGETAAPHAFPLSPVQMRRVREYVSANLGSDIGLAELAEQAGLSPHYFSLQFKRTFGVTPYRYIVSERVDEARRLLVQREVAISQIATRLGFADQSHFSRVFKTFIGTTPSRYRADN